MILQIGQLGDLFGELGLYFMSVLFHTSLKILQRLANNVNVTIVNWLCTPELSAAASSDVL